MGEPIEKSVALLLESKQPPRLRSAAVLLLVASVGPIPSLQFAVGP